MSDPVDPPGNSPSRRRARLLLAVVLGPLAASVAFGLYVLTSSPEGWGLLLGINGAVILYPVSLALILLVILPAYFAIGRSRAAVWHLTWLAALGAILMFIAFSLFTGSFGPAREWFWPPLTGALLGQVFGRLAGPRERSDLR